MNDPGLHEPVNDATKDLETNPYEHEQEEEEKEEEDFLDPSRWWFASTACPLIAGTMGPIANAFSICALVQNWRVYLPTPDTAEGYGENVKDSPWLLALNAIQLALALLANVFLLLNMARRVSFAIAQPITIIGWFLSSFILIALVSVASSEVFRLSQPPEMRALTQAFYYGIMAAVLYFVTASLMVVTVVGAYRGHYEKEFRLTISQRTLMLQTIMFMGYLLLGSLVFSRIEGWKFLDTVYWADFTLLTVGIGSSFTPKTHAGRALLFPYAIGGIVMVGLVIGSIRSLILERGKEKMETRMTEKEREKILKTLDEGKHEIRTGILHRHQTYNTPGMEEIDRREEEFLIMRKIQSKAEKKRRYLALAMSTTAALFLWFVGAVVFWKAERQHQSWSYFVSLYFSYTSLLTIGYGDFEPQSNSGKAFFVFWSLMAVPTLTILISNMGDTVVKGFSEATIWVGSLTVLPGEKGAQASLRSVINRATGGMVFQQEEHARIDKPPGLLASQNNKPQPKKQPHEDHLASRLAEHLEEEELQKALEADEEGDDLERDVRFYHYILAKELRRIMQDVQTSPPKQYSYKEWSYYLMLLGEDENNPERHRAPPIHPQEKKEEKDVSNAGKANKKWSWLGIRSPLMGNKSEPEWLLERLSSTLERELAKLGVHGSDKEKSDEKPPISMKHARDFRKRSNGGGSSERSSSRQSSTTAAETGDGLEVENRSSSKQRKKDA